MRVSPRDLKAVRVGGRVTRYAVLGDAVFVIADIPDAGAPAVATPLQLHRGRSTGMCNLRGCMLGGSGPDLARGGCLSHETPTLQSASAADARA